MALHEPVIESSAPPAADMAPTPDPAGADAPVLRIHPLWPIGIFLLTLIIYALCTRQVLIYTNPPTGDQPFYLHTAISIVQDGDIDEHNNYTDQDERLYYPRTRYAADFKGILAPYPLPPHNGHTVNRPADEWYSKHGLGLSVMIVPGWVLGTTFDPPFINLDELDLPSGGWPMVVYQMNILGALLAAQIFLLAYEATRRRGIALVVWAALAFSNPLMTYSYLIFPELPAGLCAIYAFRRLARGWKSNGPVRLVLVGIAIGFLPWLHARFLPISGALALYALWGWWQARKAEGAALDRPIRPLWDWGKLVAFVLPGALSLVLLGWYYYWLYGTVLPNTGDHAGFIDPRSDPFGLPVAMLGLLFDQQWGLLIAAPVYVLALVGFVALWVTPSKRAQAAWLLAVCVPYFLLVAEYRQWWGEWCPPARYLATIGPLMALPLAQTLLVLGRRLSYIVLFYGLTFLGWLTMVGMIAYPHAFWNQPDGKSVLFTWVNEQFHFNLVPHLPAVVLWSWDHAYPMRWDLLLAWTGIAAIIVVAGLLMLQETRAEIDRRFAFRNYRPAQH
jgi:hypothetical protein